MLKTFGLLGNTAAKTAPEEDGRVVELFRSRAELRKQHEELGQEVQRLRDRLKQQEGATSRVQEMVDSLEKRLESADTGLSTLVFYHLRALWGDGREIIGLLVNDLAMKQEERERKAFALEGNRRQFQLRKDTEQQLRIEGGELLAKRPALQDAVTAADAALQAARARCENLEKAGAGEFPGISVESRRAINIAAIACAEVLCLRLARTNLVAAARAAMSKREPTEYYGDLPACVSLMSDIVKARSLLKQRGSITQDVAQRSERIRATAAYLGEFETVPIPESCAVSQGDVLTHGSQGVTAAKLPNVLAQDTWDLFKVLLR